MTHDLPIARLKPSSLNPRKHFDEASLAELMDSVALNGVLSNLIVRPSWCIGTVTAADMKKAAAPASGPERELDYEIVSGERRYRAALGVVNKRYGSAGTMLVPVRVKSMTDPQVLAINLTEQMQRNQLTPLEEAEAFAQLLAYKDENGAPLHDVGSLAQSVAKAHDYVLDRLQLRRLPACVKKALTAGDILPSVARRVARVPDPALREEAGKLMLTGGRDGKPMSEVEVLAMLEEKFMVSLKGAPFNQEDEALVPAAGKCSACPMRSGNIAGFAKERARTDTCTNPACYREKSQAAFLMVVEVANKLGVTVLTDKESARYFETHRTAEVRIDSDWVELDTRPMQHLLKSEVKSPPVWRELHDKARAAGMQPEVVLAKDGAGRGRWLVKSALLIAAAEKLGEPIFKGQKGEDEPVTPRAGEDAEDSFRRGKREHAEIQRKNAEDIAEKNRLRELVTAHAVRAVHGALAASWKPQPIWDVMLGLSTLANIPQQWVVQKIFATKESDPKKLRRVIALQARHHGQALVPMLLEADSLANIGLESNALKAFAEFAGVDLAAVSKTALAADMPAKPKPKKPAKSAKKTSKKRGAK